MCSSNSTKVKRIASGIIGFMLLVIVLFSSFFIAAEADHNCAEEDCSICAYILQCENMLRGIGDGTVAQLFAIALLLSVLPFTARFTAELLLETLVTKKVRLNN